MAKTNKTKAAAPEAAQGVQDEQEMSQGVQAQETVPAASDAPQESAVTQEIIGPDGAEELLGCQDGDEAELAEGLLQPYAVTDCEHLNLREGPSLDASIITVLPRGAGVFGDGEQGPDGWRHVRTGRLSGWMMDKHLEALPLPELAYGAG